MKLTAIEKDEASALLSVMEMHYIPCNLCAIWLIDDSRQNQAVSRPGCLSIVFLVSKVLK